MEYLDINMMKIISSFIFIVVFFKIVFKKIISKYSGVENGYIISLVNSLKGFDYLVGIIIGVYLITYFVVLDNRWVILIEKISTAIIIIMITRVASKTASYVIKNLKYQGEDTIFSTSILATISEVSIYVIGILILLQNFGLSIAPILTALGVGGLAIALALQDTLSNLFSGLHILMSKPVKVGDYIKLSSGEEGYIEDISWRSTNIRTMGNNMIIIPNKNVAANNITNYAEPKDQGTLVISVGVAYDMDLDIVENITIEVARKIMKRLVKTSNDFDPYVRYTSFGESSVDFKVILMMDNYLDQYKIKHEFLKELYKEFYNRKIIIPFPTRRVLLEKL